MPQKKNKLMTVALVDDHSLFRNAVASTIQKFEQQIFKVVLEAENGKDFIDKLTLLPESPEILLLDINMPEMDGFETTKWVVTNYPDTKILIFSMYSDPSIIASIMKEGAIGYIPKSISIGELETAMLSVATKGYYYSDFLASKLIETLRNIDYQRELHQPVKIYNDKLLTNREKEFLELLCTELSYKDIAEQMKVSSRTIDGYRENLFKKLEVTSRVGLVMYAIRVGIYKIDIEL